MGAADPTVDVAGSCRPGHQPRLPALRLRRLNRATLARQFLLERVSRPAVDLIEHLGGMQSQAPLAPYIGLWTRLRSFLPDELSDLPLRRDVVRVHVMRNTLHLVSRRDCLEWRGLFDAQHRAEFRAHFPGGLGDVDPGDPLHEAQRLLEERPRTRAELGTLLARRWPGADPSVLAYAVSHHLPLCAVPTRGIWGRTGPAAWAPVESWLGAPLRAVPVDGLVLRYLGGFGPAGVADVQLWSGLRGLREVIERLPLQEFRTEDGEVLYDLPEAPRPPEDLPAPPRFLPAYDNLLLSDADRRRVIADGRAVPLPPGNGARVGTILVDGIWRGTWEIRNHALRVTSFVTLRREERDALVAEGERLHAFVEPAVRPEVVLDEP